MPAITSGRVLVTGANGYLAAWVVKDLLDSGFSVRGTVRSESKATYLREYFGKIYGDRFEVVIVEDITKDGAFDSCMHGINAVMHLATSVGFDADDPDEAILPSVNGTKSILNTALTPKHRASIKRVVLMSSDAANWGPPPEGQPTGPQVIDERDWNKHSVDVVREKGRDAPGTEKYRAGKVLAERAAWDMYELARADGQLEWELVTLTCPWIFGPMVHEARTPESFGLSPKLWYDQVVKGQAKNDPVKMKKDGWGFVDVRDLARAHVLALTVPAAGGERFMISGHLFVWQYFLDTAHRLDDKIPAGDPTFKDDDPEYVITRNTEKSQRVLGLRYRTMEETTKDILADFRSRGWL
ncbi:NAD(P)-binding protein [Daedaleopsis nitida]|nr:NAD(P)-binding protein [Daedaleopsis nitida]